MSLDELRSWLEKQLRVSNGEFEILWRKLEHLEVLSEYGAKDLSRQDVLDIAIERVEYGRAFAAARPEAANFTSKGRVPAKPPEEGREETFTVDLGEIAEERITAFSEAETLRTGRRPERSEVDPFRVSVTYQTPGEGARRARISFTLEPWVSTKEVGRVYKHLQEQILGGDNRQTKVANLRLLRFVDEQTRETGQRPPWRTLMAAWNEKEPDHRQEDVRSFRRAYERTRANVVYPRHNVVNVGESSDEFMRRMGAKMIGF